MSARISPNTVVGTKISRAVAAKGALMSWSARAFGALSAGVGTVAGITPHVLHHIGPVAGAAILTGTEGSVLFGAIGFVLTIPLLYKLKRRFGTWAAPGVALGLFALMFTVSTLWIGPWIRGGSDGGGTEPVDEHHTRIEQGGDLNLTYQGVLVLSPSRQSAVPSPRTRSLA